MGSGIFAAAVHAHVRVDEPVVPGKAKEPIKREVEQEAAREADREGKRQPPSPPTRESESSPARSAPDVASPRAVDDIGDDDAITPEDAGEMYRMLLSEEIDADESAQSPGSDSAPDQNDASEADDHKLTDRPATDDSASDSPASDDAQAINEMLDDLLDNVIGSADHHTPNRTDDKK
jgi:hypothetical protein